MSIDFTSLFVPPVPFTPEQLKLSGSLREQGIVHCDWCLTTEGIIAPSPFEFYQMGADKPNVLSLCSVCSAKQLQNYSTWEQQRFRKLG